MSRRWTSSISLALGSGLAMAMAFPKPHWPVLAWVSVAGLMLATVRAQPRRAVLWGFLHGAVFYGVSLAWIYTVLRVHGNATPAEAAGVLALVVAAASCFPAAFACGTAWLARRSLARACLAAPFLWVALEFGRTHVPAIGFPWNLLGYAASGDLGLLQLAAVTGIYGLSFLIVAYNALLAWAWLERRRVARRRAWGGVAAATLFLVATTLAGGKLLPEVTPHHFARLVQTNFEELAFYPPDWLDRHAADLDELERLSIHPGQHKDDLIVWPEVPAPFSLQDQRFAARAERVAQQSRANFLVGVVDWKVAAKPAATPGQSNFEPYNSAALLDSTGRRVFLYDKIHLVPFGEYVPLRRWLTFASKMTSQVGDFQPGSAYQVGRLGGSEGTEFGVFICYESIFPNEVRQFVANGAELLINISNDGWFGGTAAPAQHLAMARVRAVENRRWLLRATNTGLSVSLDPYGRYAARMAPDMRGALEAPYDFRTDPTPYSRWGDWAAWLSVAIVAGFLLEGVSRRVQPEA